jgi:[ribosomal protein S18]-alanine N-acetyltransferase
VGDDWGIPSLRFTKQSYRPTRMLSKYILTRQPVVVQCEPNIDVPMENPKHTLSHGSAAPARAYPALQPLTASRQALFASPVELRRATLADVPSILDLERACFSSAEETFNRRQVRYLIGDPRATVTVAVQDERVLGWAVGLVRQHRKTRSGRLYAVAVHPAAQGRRLGRALVERTLTALADLGIVRIYLEVRADNAPAISLYRKLGFVHSRELPNYYSLGNHGRSMKLALAASSNPAARDAAGQLTWAWAESEAPAPLR